MIALLIFLVVLFVVFTLFKDLFRVAFIAPLILVGLAAFFVMHA